MANALAQLNQYRDAMKLKDAAYRALDDSKVFQQRRWDRLAEVIDDAALQCRN
jgi:surface antigen